MNEKYPFLDAIIKKSEPDTLDREELIALAKSAFTFLSKAQHNIALKENGFEKRTGEEKRKEIKSHRDHLRDIFVLAGMPKGTAEYRATACIGLARRHVWELR